MGATIQEDRDRLSGSRGFLSIERRRRYLIRAMMPDIRAYDELYQRLIAKIDIYDVSSMFAMEQIKSTTELPLLYASTPSGRGTSQTPRHAAGAQ